MSYLNWVLILFLVGFLMVGGELYKHDQNLGIERDIYNYTENISLSYTSNLSQQHPIEQTQGIVNEGRVYLIVDSFINFLLTTSEQVLKMGIEYGYQNPDIDFKLIFKYLVYILIIIIIVMLIKPIGYLIILLILFGMWIKDKLDKKRKKRLKEKIGDLKDIKNETNE